MTFWAFVENSLRFHWRAHLGVVLGAAVATAVLVGALVVGDSVRYSLRETALMRLGQTHVALIASDRFFRDTLLLQKPGAPMAGLVRLSGIATRQDAAARADNVQVLGVDGPFWDMAGLPEETKEYGGSDSLLNSSRSYSLPSPGEAFITESLARRLHIAEGDTFLVRTPKPHGMALEAPLSNPADASEVLRLKVRAIIRHSPAGRFSLEANQAAPLNVFVEKSWLQKQLGLTGQSNVLLVGNLFSTPAIANAALREAWQLADAELALRPLESERGLELTSRRIFLDTPVVEAAAAEPGAVGILTYFVNELHVGDRAAPYSMVTAVGPLEAKGPAWSPLVSLLPVDMADDQVVINSWLAEDLNAKPGDWLEMTYYVVGPSNRLETRTDRFRIRTIVSIDGVAGDRSLMPDFPGLADVEKSRDWKPGLPIDFKKIRDKDEKYWDKYRGTPKAFVTLAAGRRMWANRFGDLTAVRFPATQSPDALAQSLRDRIDPATLGLYFQDVRGRALASAESATDFGQLFLGLSLFLVAAALVLAAMLFGLGVEQRSEEVGTLLALGIPARRVRRMFLAEGAVLALIGGAAGIVGGLLYTRAVLGALATVWQGAVGGADLFFHADPLSAAGGAAAGFAAALAAIWIVARRQARLPVRELLASGTEAELAPSLPRARAGRSAAAAVIAGIGAAVVIATAPAGGGEAAAGAFFGAGALFLIATLGACLAALALLARPAAPGRMNLGRLALSNAARRRGRSLATITLLACGVFMVIAVGANRLGGPSDPTRRDSGTGGFALYAETTMPVARDLNSPDGRKAFGLPAPGAAESGAPSFEVVPLRVHAGDEASCLNLNRPQQPRLVGVNPKVLAERSSFTFAETSGHGSGGSPWLILEQPTAGGAVPAVADQTTITWSLGKKVGDEIPYTDDRGRTFQIRLVGAIENSILQGALVISERDFLEKFPSEGGYRAWLIDATPAEAAAVSKVLTRQMSDVGMAVTPTADRLASFNAVENTYLAIFQALGGLGLALGSAGLAVVVLRNVMERRGELALMRAVGFPARRLLLLVLGEHWLLLAMGMACGTAAAMAAVWPALASGGSQVPWLSLAVTLGTVLAAAVLWIYLAARLALRGPLMDSLRNE